MVWFHYVSPNYMTCFYFKLGGLEVSLPLPSGLENAGRLLQSWALYRKDVATTPIKSPGSTSESRQPRREPFLVRKKGHCLSCLCQLFHKSVKDHTWRVSAFGRQMNHLAKNRWKDDMPLGISFHTGGRTRT